MMRAAAGPRTDVIPSPEDFPKLSGRELLEAAAGGYVGLDQRWLHALLDDPDRTIDDIVRFAAETRDDRVELVQDLALIAAYLRRPELLPFLIELVREDGGEPPDDLVETVIGFREAALEPLLGLYAELGHATAVPFMLASLGVHDERIEAVLDEVSAADPEEGAFCREVYEAVAGSPSETEQFPIWNEYPEEDPPPVDLFLPPERLVFLDAASAETRLQAIASLEAEEEMASDAIERVWKLARTDPDDRVRAAAWTALEGQLDQQEGLREEMRERIFNPETPPVEVAGLAVTLAGESDPEIVERVRQLFRKAATRAVATEAMGASFDTGYTKYIEQALDDPDLDVRRAAVVAAGQLRLKGELGRMKTLFSDPDLRAPALVAYGLTFPSVATPARMRSLFKKIDNLAGGLDDDEAGLLEHILDERLAVAGKGPAFHNH